MGISTISDKERSNLFIPKSKDKAKDRNASRGSDCHPVTASSPSVLPWDSRSDYCWESSWRSSPRHLRLPWPCLCEKCQTCLQVSWDDSMILQLTKINHYCRHWKYVVETPMLWNWARLKVQSSNCQEILESPVLDFVSGIRVIWWDSGCPSTVTRIFSGMLAGDLPQLRKLDLDNSPLGSVESRLLQVRLHLFIHHSWIL